MMSVMAEGLDELAEESRAVLTAVEEDSDSGYLIPTRTLRRNYTGDDVLSVQLRLTELGYYTVSTTSVYDTATISAVTQFQKRNSLTADGVAGTKTYAKLYSAEAIPAASVTPTPTATATSAWNVPTRTLKIGSTGSDVTTVEERLQDLGYYTGTIGTYYNAAVYNAVKAFQSANGLTADGIAGTKTYSKLFSDSAVPVKTATPVATATPTPVPTATATSAWNVPTRTLKVGYSGSDVTVVEERLQELGYYTGVIGTYYNTTVYNAVKAFQKANGLTADGIAGTNTYSKLFSDSAVPATTATPAVTATATPTATPAPTWNVPTRTLKVGSSGNDVTVVEKRLQELGYYTGVIGTYYNTTVYNAVKDFQKANGLTADGIAGTNTYSKLFSDSAVPATTATPAVTVTATPTATPAPTWNVPTRTLKVGSSGSDVTAVEERLQELGYYTGVIGTYYNTTVYNAVKAFQKANGLTADGIAGTNTYNKLFSENAVPAATATPAVTATPTATATSTATTKPTATPTPGSYDVPTRTLKNGLYGDDVKAVQSRLKELGYFTTPISGLYSTATILAVKSFQANNGLTADGVAGTKTYAILFSASAKAASADPTTEPTAAPTVSYTTLKSGSTGTAVKTLQTALKNLGYTVTVNSSYDATTVAAVKAFQTNNYLSVDGIAGTETQTLLLEGPAINASTTPTASYTTLNVNTASGSSAVTALQNRLKELGYTVTVNGKYDGVTHNAVVAFQQRNGLMISGIANGATQNILYSDGAKDADTEVSTLPSSTGKIEAPENVQLLWWYDDVKPSIKSGQVVLVYDPETNISWNITLYSLGHHADSQPTTWQDTQLMNRSFGSTSWTCHPVYVRLTDGRWTLAAMHNYPHLYGSISNNGFGGHLCIHFLRTYDECISAGDSVYGVEMQDTIRKYWLALTGITVE